MCCSSGDGWRKWVLMLEREQRMACAEKVEGEGSRKYDETSNFSENLKRFFGWLFVPYFGRYSTVCTVGMGGTAW